MQHVKIKNAKIKGALSRVGYQYGFSYYRTGIYQTEHNPHSVPHFGATKLTEQSVMLFALWRCITNVTYLPCKLC